MTVALLTLTCLSRPQRSCRYLRRSPSDSVRPGVNLKPRSSTPPRAEARLPHALAKSPPSTRPLLAPPKGHQLETRVWLRQAFLPASTPPRRAPLRQPSSLPGRLDRPSLRTPARRPTNRTTGRSPLLHDRILGASGTPRRVSLPPRNPHASSSVPSRRTHRRPRPAARNTLPGRLATSATITRATSPEGEPAQTPVTSAAPRLPRLRFKNTRRSLVHTTASPLRPAPIQGFPGPESPFQPPCSMPGGFALTPPRRQPGGHRHGDPVAPPLRDHGPAPRSDPKVFPERRLRPLRPADFWVVLPPISTNSFGKDDHTASAPSRSAFRALLRLRVRCNLAAVQTAGRPMLS
jgi:hypothetical protein